MVIHGNMYILEYGCTDIMCTYLVNDYWHKVSGNIYFLYSNMSGYLNNWQLIWLTKHLSRLAVYGGLNGNYLTKIIPLDIACIARVTLLYYFLVYFAQVKINKDLESLWLAYIRINGTVTFCAPFAYFEEL